MTFSIGVMVLQYATDDYCFASIKMKMKPVDIGIPEKWTKEGLPHKSDHCHIIVDFAF